ncbi:MAG: hypothetical protein OEY14_18780, partial [Myxococcales bacterium]|nr:hypothetical protein [Myxococcales bacterium]
MLPPPFVLRGYAAPDPLDAAPARSRLLLHLGVTGALYGLLLYVTILVFELAVLPADSLIWVEWGIVMLFYAPLALALRKSSSLVLIGMILAIGMPLDLFVQAHFRDVGLPALWAYPADSAIGGLPPLGRFALIWIGDGIVAGPLSLWIGRLLAKAIWGDAPAGSRFTSKAYTELFGAAWTRDEVDPPGRDWVFWAYRILGLVYLGYLGLVILGLAGVSPWPDSIEPLLTQTYENPALTINTFIKLGIMASLAFAAAYAPSLRWHVSLVLLFGHAVSTVASAGFYLADAPDTPYRAFLLVSALVDLGLMLLFGLVMFRHRGLASAFARDKEFPAFYSLPHRLTKLLFYGFGLSLLAVLGLILLARIGLDPSRGLGAVYGFPEPQLCNTLTKYATLAFLCLLLAEREALRERLVGVLHLACAISVLGGALFLLIGDGVGELRLATRGGTPALADWYFMVLVALNGSVLIALMALRRLFYDVEYAVVALGPSGARAVVALHEA